MSTHVVRASKVFVLSMLCMLSLGQALDNAPQVSPGPESRGPASSDFVPSDYAELERQIESLKHENLMLESQEEQLRDENQKAEARLQRQQGRIVMLEGGQRIMNPVRFISPGLANAAFLCGAFALLILVIAYPVPARKVLSLSFPFELASYKSNRDKTPSLSHAAQIIWMILFIFLLIMLAVPAMSQDDVTEQGQEMPDDHMPGENAKIAEGEEVEDNLAEGERTEVSKEPEGDGAVAAATAAEGEGEMPSAKISEGEAAAPAEETTGIPTSRIQPELNQAVELINLTPLERAIHILDTLPEGKTVRLTLDNEVLQRLVESAKQHNHLPIVRIPEPPEISITEELPFGSLGYYFLKASLYESAGRDSVRELLEQGATPLVENNGSALSRIDMAALGTIMSFLAAYKSVDNVKVMISAAIDKVEKLGDIVTILEAAQQTGLGAEYLKAVEILFAEQQKYVVVENIANLALQHDQKAAAELVVTSAIKNLYPDLGENLKVVRLLDKIADKARVKAQLEALANFESLDNVLIIAQTASELGLPAAEEALLVKGVAVAESGQDYASLISAAQRRNLVSAIAPPLGRRLLSMQDRMLYKFTCSWPDGFGAALYDKEEVSLGVWTGVQLYQADKSSSPARQLLETTVHLQLGKIIDSVGASPLLALNDMYALVHYYTETGTEGVNTAMDMLALQRRLRGLSDEKVSTEDPRLLALQMELDQQKLRNKDLKSSLASLDERRVSLSRQEAEANTQFLILAAEISAKVFLLLLALWIAFARAVASAKTAPGFRFSHFCLTFMETVGFECCCTVIMVVPGVVITLVSQDRLKHLRIAECALAPVVSCDQGSNGTLASVSCDTVFPPPLSKED